VTEADPNHDDSEIIARAQAAKQAHGSFLLGLPNVVGVGVGLRMRQGQSTGEVALVVMVNKKIADAELTPDQLIPRELDGVPIDVLEVGELKAGDAAGG
jgi:hypothetical protein